jgi:VanZ family protein
MTIRTLFQIAAWLSLMAIVALSLATPSLRPVTFLPPALEHAAIFGLAGIAAGLGYPSRTALTTAALVVFAGAVEVAQHFVPGRHARLRDFVVDAGAAIIGVVLAGLVARLRAQQGQLNSTTSSSQHNQMLGARNSPNGNFSATSSRCPPA